jgi:hypothetical protein
MSESPRALGGNLGYFVTKSSNYRSPDGEDNTAYKAMINTEDRATDAESHMELIKEYFQRNSSEEVVAIYPVTKYEHAFLKYTRGVKSSWDYSHNGFYIVTDKTQEKVGTPDDKITSVIDKELETYTQWANGEVYQFTLYDDTGDVKDACGEFYNLKDMKMHLPEEWEDENLRDYYEPNF